MYQPAVYQPAGYQPAGNAISKALLAPIELTIAPISFGEPSRWPIGGWQGAAKRLSDIAIASLLLAVLAAPMLLLACLIRLESPGPALFRQRRVGFANVGFEMWKFRTMRHHAPEHGRLTQTTRHDPRVTRLGALLRHFSLDELPQLLNVLRGEMSMVGPRPHAPGTCAGGKPFELVTPHYSARHRVRPGMTGLAQVRGWRGETDTEEKLLMRLAADLEFIAHWSLWLDFNILVRTAVAIFAMRNAY
ncbi:MAG TPA: sugar transferase [Acetobacteraceae bacterium]|jgi:lipopolysaccharide/colanic/teichoic acid biosynthesis glycosyltransferase|nr:sugar transferase [Acetobacteraceae bacterium]